EPAELVAVLVGLGVLAVRDVQAVDPHAREGRAEHPLLLVDIAADSVRDVGGLDPRYERHAVVAGLAANDRAVAQRSQRIGRKVLVLCLDLLQCEHVGLLAVEPREHVFETNLDAIDVPRRDLHCRVAGAEMPDWRRSASSSGGRPRNSTNASSALRLPPTARIARRKRSAVARSNRPASSNAPNASAASTSAHL